MGRQYSYIAAFLLLSSFCYSQARIVINDNAFINISGNAFVVIDNPASNALSTAGSGGNLITEGENNRLRWNIGSATGVYTIPFYDDDNAASIPFVFNIGTAGAAGGSIDFSTYDNPSWDNNGYRPSDVGNMNSFIGGPNNSSHVIDRFWIVDASTYALKPGATLSFTYLDAEWSAAGNAIIEGNLGAQRFNTPAGNWDAYIPMGTVNTATNTVSGVPAAAADLFRSWTLAELSSPLPVELLSFQGKCENGSVTLNWSTATESNNDHFTVERSQDGQNFMAIGTVAGAGNSSTITQYQFSDPSPMSGTNYYRLLQTDHNGDQEYFNTITVSSCSSASTIGIYCSQPDNIAHIETSSVTGNLEVFLFNSLGQVVLSKKLSTQPGYNSFLIDLSSYRQGAYFLSVTGNDIKSVQKVIIR